MLFLKKNHLHLLQSLKSQFNARTYPLKCPIFVYSTSAIQQDKPLKPRFIIDYLINSCGLSENEAVKASTKILHIRSLSNPDSVILFLKENGFSDADIKQVVSAQPTFLCSKVEKTLVPRLNILKEIGFSGSEIVEFVSNNPNVLRTRNVKHKLELLKEITGSHTELVHLCKKNYKIIGSNLQKVLLPNLSLLKECIRNCQLATVLKFHPSLIIYPSNVLEKLIEHTKEFGIPCQSGMFLYMLSALSINSKEDIEAKIKMFKNFGLSEEEVFSAIRKAPGILRFKEEVMRAKLEFFVNTAACKPSYISRHPMLLTYSLNKRVIPRFRILQKLKFHGVLTREFDMWSVICLTDKAFQKKFVLPYNEF